MVHFTVFGGSEVSLSHSGQFIFTLFGGTEVRKPTLAKRLMQERQRLLAERETPNPQPDQVDKLINFLDGSSGGRSGGLSRRKAFILTIFGSTELIPPSIAEEFMDMRELVSSGLISDQEWDQLVGRLYQLGDLDPISSFTLFGAMGEDQIKEEEEIKKIRSANELGLISDEEAHALRSVVGRDPQQVRALLRQTAFS